MVWVILERCVQLTTLILLILMVVVIFSSNRSVEERNTFNLQLEEFRQDVIKVRARNIAYLEGKVNKVSENQDNYQNTTGSKLNILEQRVLKIEQEDKKNNRVVNVNNNNNTQNNNPAVSQ